MKPLLLVIMAASKNVRKMSATKELKIYSRLKRCSFCSENSCCSNYCPNYCRRNTAKDLLTLAKLKVWSPFQSFCLWELCNRNDFCINTRLHTIHWGIGCTPTLKSKLDGKLPILRVLGDIPDSSPVSFKRASLYLDQTVDPVRRVLSDIPDNSSVVHTNRVNFQLYPTQSWL